MSELELNAGAEWHPKKNIGGSLLPSREPRLLVPIKSKFGVFQVVQDFKADTHRLMLDGKEIASHPNGYCVHNLAERIVAGDMKRIEAQAKWIIDCAGTADISFLKGGNPMK